MASFQRIVLALALGGCGPPRADEATAIEPTAYDYRAADFTPDDPALEVSAAAFTEALPELLGLLRSIDPELVSVSTLDAMSLSDGVCPEMHEHNSQPAWWEDCETVDGHFYRGQMLYLYWYDVPIDDDRFRRFLWNTGQAIIDFADGTRFMMMGNASVQDYTRPDRVHAIDIELTGDNLNTRPAFEGTWLAGNFHTWLFMEIRTTPEGERTWWIDGNLTRLGGFLAAATFDDMTFHRSPRACALEPTGALSGRDTEGHWYVLTFDGQDDEGFATDACDGCAPLTIDGEAAGEVCADYAAWQTWEDWPW
ncbi:MAG: hypothetical protein H6739_01345 [Alphaproteobacteria bacterium]|nr:hypothetical protein [Alphaproteobacteria bacterium]